MEVKEDIVGPRIFRVGGRLRVIRDEAKAESQDKRDICMVRSIGGQKKPQ